MVGPRAVYLETASPVDEEVGVDTSPADVLDCVIHLTRQAFAYIVRRVTYRFCRARGEERSWHSQPDATRLPVR